MRIIVFFDLPTETAKDRKVYSKFRKDLINEGFIMIQKSVYAKLALNNSIVKSIRDKIEKVKPPKGILQLLVITERQFSEIDYIVGQNSSDILNNTDRMIII